MKAWFTGALAATSLAALLLGGGCSPGGRAAGSTSKPHHVAPDVPPSAVASAGATPTPVPDPPSTVSCDVYARNFDESRSGVYFKDATNGPSIKKPPPGMEFADLYISNSNFHGHGILEVPWMGSTLFSWETSIVSMGPCRGLSSISAAPSAGYQFAAPLKVGTGYVVRRLSADGRKQSYARLFVYDWLRDPAGKVIGARVKWTVQPDGGRVFLQ